MKQKLSTVLLFISCLCGILSAQEWEQLNDTPFYRHHSNGFGINGKAYVIEGVGVIDEAHQWIWEYDPGIDSWTQIDTFPGVDRGFPIGDEWDSKYYFGFGVTFNGVELTFLNDLWVFDPLTESFTELPSCPCTGRSHPALIAHNGKVFMGAGSSGFGDLDDWWEYDIATQVWTQKENIPGGDRHHPFFFGMGDYVYVGGGHVFNWLQYDPIQEIWTAIDNYPEGRVAGTQFNYNGKGFVLAGDDWNHVSIPNAFTFLGYDPEDNQWEVLPPLPNGSRWAPSSFILDGEIYFFGGVSDFVENDSSMWRFDLSTLEDPPVSTRELDLNIEVYPNPFIDLVSIRGAVNEPDDYQVRITDVNGMVVWQQADFYVNQSDINLSFLPKGVYFLRLEKEGQFAHVKMVKTD